MPASMKPHVASLGARPSSRSRSSSPSSLAWHLATRGTGPVAADGPRIRQAHGRDRDPGQVGDAGPARRRRQALGAHQAAVLRQRPERQGRRHPARLLDRARRRRLSAGGAGRDPDRLPDRHVAADEPGARSVHPGAQADLAARLDAARALHHQGFRPVVDLRDLHLLALADDDQHRVRRRGGAHANGSTSRARSKSARCGAPSPSSCRRRRRPSSPACASRSASPGW